MNGSVIIIIGFPIIALFFVINFLKWKNAHKLRVRDPINKGNYVKDFLMSEKKDKETHIVYWESLWWQRKLKVERPPEKAIDVSVGRLVAECYYISEGQYLWIGDEGIEVKEVETNDGKKVVKWIVDRKTGDVVDKFKPLTQIQRETVLNQYAKAELIGGKTWTADKIIMAGSIGFIMMVVIVGLIFAPDILESYTLSKKVNVDVAQQYLEITEAQSQITAMLYGKINDYDITITQDIGSKKGGGGVLTNDSTPPKD